MNLEDLDIDELEELFEVKEVALGDLNNALENLQKAIYDIEDIEYDEIQGIVEQLNAEKKNLSDIKKFIEQDMEEIENQIETLQEWEDDDPNERDREYRDMQGF